MYFLNVFEDCYRNRRNANKKMLWFIENHFIKSIFYSSKPNIFFIKAKS